jgi:hypothetical protein
MRIWKKKNDDKRKVVGLTEIVEISGAKGSIKKKALLDTGATRTSVDINVAAKAGLGPIIDSVRIKNASLGGGVTQRIIAEATIRIKNITVRTGVNIVDRRKMPYKILIGRDILHDNFLVDISKTHKSHDSKDLKVKKNGKK